MRKWRKKTGHRGEVGDKAISSCLILFGRLDWAHKTLRCRIGRFGKSVVVPLTSISKVLRPGVSLTFFAHVCIFPFFELPGTS